MRVVECNTCGETVTAENDEELAGRLKDHMESEHDDCNVLCLGGRVIGPALAADIIRAYLAAEFTGEDRHKRRLAKIDGIEREFLRDDI